MYEIAPANMMAGLEAWNRDTRNHGLDYFTANKKIKTAIAATAASEVIKYLDSIGWKQGQEQDATPPR